MKYNTNRRKYSTNQLLPHKEMKMGFFPAGLIYSIKPRTKSSKKGQSLIEYLILVALMGVATIGIVRTLNQTVKSRFASAVYALQGKNQKAKTHSVKTQDYQRSDLGNFMSGAASSEKK